MIAKLSHLLQFCKMASTTLFTPRAKKARTKGASKANRAPKSPREQSAQPAGPLTTQAAAALLAAVAAATPLPQHGQPSQLQAITTRQSFNRTFFRF